MVQHQPSYLVQILYTGGQITSASLIPPNMLVNLMIWMYDEGIVNSTKTEGTPVMVVNLQ